MTAFAKKETGLRIGFWGFGFVVLRNSIANLEFLAVIKCKKLLGWLKMYGEMEKQLAIAHLPAILCV